MAVYVNVSSLLLVRSVMQPVGGQTALLFEYVPVASTGELASPTSPVTDTLQGLTKPSSAIPFFVSIRRK